MTLRSHPTTGGKGSLQMGGTKIVQGERACKEVVAIGLNFKQSGGGNTPAAHCIFSWCHDRKEGTVKNIVRGKDYVGPGEARNIRGMQKLRDSD